MKTRTCGLTVTLWDGHTVDYLWATGAHADRYWDLHIYHGRRQRAYHPAGEWRSYQIYSGCPENEPPAYPIAPPEAVTQALAVMERTGRPGLRLERGFTKMARVEAP
jgi:hypothetical protein